MACPWSCACDPPPPLIKVASNTRPYSKLGGTTLNGREEGGQCYILQTCDQERFETRKVVFPWECLIIFATGCSIVHVHLSLFVSMVLWNEIQCALIFAILHGFFFSWNHSLFPKSSFPDFISDHVYDIVTCVFQYLEMLRRQEPLEWIFKEYQVQIW